MLRGLIPAVVLASCTPAPGPFDASMPDGGAAEDAGTDPDAGASDASTPDAGSPDSGPGDGGTDAGVPRPDHLAVFAQSHLVQLLSDTGTVAGQFQMHSDATAFSAHFPLAGDFDGTGQETIGYYDLLRAEVHVRAANGARTTETVFQLGSPRFQSFAVVGDFDGDKRDSVGVYAVDTGEFRLRNALGSGAFDTTFVFGAPRLFPLAGDFDGDGVDTIGVYDPSTGEFALRNSNSAGAADIRFRFGPLNSVPFVVDLDGDGSDSVGVYDAPNNLIRLRASLAPNASEQTVSVATSNYVWLPVAGRFAPVQAQGVQPFAWPTATAQSQNIDPARLDSALTQAGQQADRLSVLVVRNGKLVAERYFHGAEATHANNIKSVSKSLLGALVGMAAKQGRLATTDLLSARLPAAFANITDARKRQITLGHLLTMTAGMQLDDGGALRTMIGSSDWVESILAAPSVANPGSQFAYATGLTHLASAVLQQSYGQKTKAVAQAQLTDPLGVTVVRWDQDPQGVSMGGAEVYMVPRDLARFGELYLRRGTLDSVTHVDPAWVDTSLATLLPASAVDGLHGYGLWWWTATFAGRPCSFAWGYGGQFIFIVPSASLVVVMTSRSDVDATRSGVNAYDAFNVLESGILPAVQ